MRLSGIDDILFQSILGAIVFTLIFILIIISLVPKTTKPKGSENKNPDKNISLKETVQFIAGILLLTTVNLILLQLWL